MFNSQIHKTANFMSLFFIISLFTASRFSSSKSLRQNIALAAPFELGLFISSPSALTWFLFIRSLEFFTFKMRRHIFFMICEWHWFLIEQLHKWLQGDAFIEQKRKQRSVLTSHCPNLSNLFNGFYSLHCCFIHFLVNLNVSDNIAPQTGTLINRAGRLKR